MPKIIANKISIHYEERGAGQPVLFIGGTGADLRAKPNVLDGPLPKTRRVIVYDQRGLGQTDKPNIDYSMSDYADDAAAIVKALDCNHLDVIGVSFGGMVALHLALRHPEVVGKLVLCCTSSGGDYSSYPFHELPEDLSAEQRLRTLMPVNDTRRDQKWQEEHPEIVASMLEYTKAHAIEDHATPEFKQGARRQLVARSQHDVQQRLGEITAETLICAGKYDAIAPSENQHALRSGLKNSELKWYEGGHLFLTQDKQALQDIVAFMG